MGVLGFLSLQVNVLAALVLVFLRGLLRAQIVFWALVIDVCVMVYLYRKVPVNKRPWLLAGIVLEFQAVLLIGLPLSGLTGELLAPDFMQPYVFALLVVGALLELWSLFKRAPRTSTVVPPSP